MAFQIVIALYGDSHTPYATVLLKSLHRVGHYCIRFIDLEDVPNERKDRIARKLEAWYEAFAQCLDGTNVVFLDADTMVMKPLDSVFADNPSFDVAHTVRHDRRWPINSGVVFVRASEKTRRWFRAWRDLSAWTYSLEERKQNAVAHWGHVDQAALPASLGMHKDLEVTELPAQVWNEDRVSENPDDVAIFHLKGVLPMLLKPYEDNDLGDQRLRKEQFETWRALYGADTAL